jgi:hypothetical protein
MEEEDRRRVWRLYGWSTALMAGGSCVGTVAWAANMMSVVNTFKGNARSIYVEKLLLTSLNYSWFPVYIVTYAIECMSAAQLMLLDRMSVFAAPQGTRLQKRWAAAVRVVMAAVVLGNAVGLAANAAAAVHCHKAAQATGAASEQYAANSTTRGDNLYSLSKKRCNVPAPLQPCRGSARLSCSSLSSRLL